MTAPIYTLSRATPSGVKLVAKGGVYADLCSLAETAAKGEQPGCGWIVGKDGGEDNMAQFWATGTNRAGKLEVV